MAMSGYERVRRWEQRQSAIRAKLYADRNWPQLHTDASSWSWRQCAIRKRWVIYYARRRQAEMLGLGLEPRRPNHWVGPIERAKKQAKANKPTVNLCLVKHIAQFNGLR